MPVEATGTRVAPNARLLAALSAQQRAELEFLSGVCDTAVTDGKTRGVLAGCACCPPFDDCPPVRGATPRGDVDEAYALRTRSDGSFSAPGRRELSLTFDGCESHAQNWGGTLLCRSEPDGIWFVEYESGLRPDRCQPLRLPDGHDVLVCEWQDAHQGHSRSYVFVFDFSHSPDAWQGLVELSDSTASGCWSDAGTPVLDSRVTAVTLRDLNRDGTLDIRVEGTTREGSVSKAYLARCGEYELAMNRWVERTGGEDRRGAPRARHLDLLGPTKRLALEFVTGARGFTPTATTQRWLDAQPKDEP
ncbi:MAG TPA: hypothetical protein VGK73_00665 [Polyangiaceae bacterium]